MTHRRTRQWIYLSSALVHAGEISVGRNSRVGSLRVSVDEQSKLSLFGAVGSTASRTRVKACNVDFVLCRRNDSKKMHAFRVENLDDGVHLCKCIAVSHQKAERLMTTSVGEQNVCTARAELDARQAMRRFHSSGTQDFTKVATIDGVDTKLADVWSRAVSHETETETQRRLARLGRGDETPTRRKVCAHFTAEHCMREHQSQFRERFDVHVTVFIGVRLVLPKFELHDARILVGRWLYLRSFNVPSSRI